MGRLGRFDSRFYSYRLYLKRQALWMEMESHLDPEFWERFIPLE